MNKFISCAVISSLLIAQLSFTVQAAPMNEESPQLVSVEIAKTEQVSPTLWLPGNVISRMNAPISAEQTGQLLWIEDIGTWVEQGQRIATIDNRHLMLQLARQEAQVKQNQANVTYLDKQKTRMSTLSQKNNTAISELEKITKDLAVAESEVIELSMLVNQTKLAIEKTHITAPFSGSITERFANVGELIAVGRPMVQLVDTNSLDIRIAAPLSIAPYIKGNDNVLVKWQDKLIELPIRTWSQAGDQLSRTFDVRLAADGLNILAGSPVTVSLPKQKTGEVTVVPRDALVLREKETFILTINDEGQAKKINVLIGQGVGRWVSVSGDIFAGDNVIVRGGERLQDGQKVRIDEGLLAKNMTNK